MPSLWILLVRAVLSQSLRLHALPNASAVKRCPSFSVEDLVCMRPPPQP
jgi:hypothetical protein